MQQPTVGRIVHYQSYGTPGGEYPSVPRAAVITEAPAPVELQGVPPEQCPEPGWHQTHNYCPACSWTRPQPGAPMVGLAVLNPEGMFFNRGVPYAEEPTPGHWSWPPRA